MASSISGPANGAHHLSQSPSSLIRAESCQRKAGASHTLQTQLPCGLVWRVLAGIELLDGNLTIHSMLIAFFVGKGKRQHAGKGRPGHALTSKSD